MIDKIYYTLQEPIEFYDVCTIYQPTIEEILKFKIHNFAKLFEPYYMALQNEDETISNLEFLYFQDIRIFNYCKELIMDSLGYLCKDKVVFHEDKIAFQIGDNKGLLNKDNFDEFLDVIFAVCGKDKPEKREVPKNMSEKQRKIWEKLQKGREQSSEKGLNLASVINVVMWGDGKYISHEEIKKMTMWTLINGYKSIIGKDNFYINFEQYLAGSEPNKLDLGHWSEKLKIK